jgi:TldD protein
MKAAFVAAGLCVGLLGAALPAAAQSKRSPPLGSPSTAVTADVLDAVAAEMQRAMSDLRIGNAPPPYHIAYKLTEVDVNDVVSSLGFATTRRHRHFVIIEARVRVGSPDLDNGNYQIPGDERTDGVAQAALPLEPTVRAARRAAWRVTDEAYKEALVQLQAKLDWRASRGAAPQVPSWSATPAMLADEPVLVPALEPLAELEQRADRLSATLRDRELRDSRVALTSYLERRWYLTSDGTRNTDTRRVSGVLIAVFGQADDGQDLPQYYTHYGHTATDLPGDAELTATAQRLADTVDALRRAPALERYSGPVLFEGEAATGIVRYTLAPHLGGTPLPEGLPPDEAKLFGGAFADRIGLKVLASSLSIVDDPTAASAAGQPLIGGYKIDDEGVAAQRVQVVKDGTLRELLRSRTPAQPGDTSNGHARRQGPGGVFHGSATNLILSGKGGLDRKALIRRLLAEAKAAGQPYGLIVRQLDDAAITAAPDLTIRELRAMRNIDRTLPPPAILVYRVTAGGKEELVRVAQLGEVSIRAWRDIVAVGKAPHVSNFLATPEGWLEHKFIGALGGGDGAVPTAGVESAVVAPALLFKELDVRPYTLGTRARPAVPARDGN